MKVIVAGSRTFTDYSLVKEALDALYDETDIEIVSGTARGADKMGERWAKENGKTVHEFFPDWDGLGKSAGYKRNEDMAKFADACICFYNGKSPGTKHMINLAKQYKLKLKVIRYA